MGQWSSFKVSELFHSNRGTNSDALVRGSERAISICLWLCSNIKSFCGLVKVTHEHCGGTSLVPSLPQGQLVLPLPWEATGAWALGMLQQDPCQAAEWCWAAEEVAAAVVERASEVLQNMGRWDWLPASERFRCGQVWGIYQSYAGRRCQLLSVASHGFSEFFYARKVLVQNFNQFRIYGNCHWLDDFWQFPSVAAKRGLSRQSCWRCPGSYAGFRDPPVQIQLQIRHLSWSSGFISLKLEVF